MGFFRRFFPMPGDVISKARKGRHRGRPALVRGAEHRGATADWSPTADVTAHDVADELLTDGMRTALLRAEVAQAISAPNFAAIDRALDDFMVRNKITWAQVGDYAVDVAATVVFEAVDGDIHRLAVELACEVAVSTPTGEWPVMRRDGELLEASNRG